MTIQGEYIDRLEDTCLNPELCHNAVLHEMAQGLKHLPQLFLSKRFFGIHSPDWGYGSSIGEACFSLQMIMMPSRENQNAMIFGSSSFVRSSINSFVKSFVEAPNTFRISLVDDFGVTLDSDRRLICDLLKKIFDKAEKSSGGFYIPIPSFYCIFLVEYLSLTFGKSWGLNEQTVLERWSSQVISEDTVPASIIDKLSISLNQYMRVGIEANPNCSEKTRVAYTLKFGQQGKN